MAHDDAGGRGIQPISGNQQAYAEKAGPILIDAAIDALIALDETARIKLVPEPEKIAA
ncbi:hypothetical protein [Shinella sp.]|uniref:hypothetical protein n=1 Tax=Shinella sp. TaxID=1870904 RepID=UPI002583B6CD|nr:hypothetical protein [Shinella sp.]MCW5706765.1 hypothetical protein [Shinella sp.]